MENTDTHLAGPGVQDQTHYSISYFHKVQVKVTFYIFDEVETKAD